MASILDRYGIKEVADVTFYEIKDNGTPDYPVLYLDTLKVSTIEQTAETADARGGKGNPKLVSWDYGKEINVTLEDALFSAKSMSIMFGNGNVYKSEKGKDSVARVSVVRLAEDATKLPDYFVADHYNKDTGSSRDKVWMNPEVNRPADATAWSAIKGLTITGIYGEKGEEINTTGIADTDAWKAVNVSAYAGQKVFIQYKLAVTSRTITISGDSFPGTYYVTGDTYARSDITGDDQFFQFIIPKAKVTSENTITLEAEGDPSVFNMNLTVLRPEDGVMMRLVQYDLEDPTATASASG